MSRGLLCAIAFTLCLSFCADKRTVVAAVSPPQPEGVPFAQTEAVATQEPSMYPLNTGNIKAMALSIPMAEALAAYGPEFLRWSLSDYPPERLKNYPYSAKSLPYAVLGDYNGDGIEDMVLVGHNKDANLVVALMSVATGYYITEVQKAFYYSKSREQGKEVPYTPNEILLFQRKGCRYGIGDMAIEEVVLKNDGFVLKNIRWFNYSTFAFTRAGDIDVYKWDSLASKFQSKPLDSSNEISIAKCALRTDFDKLTFEEKTGSNSGGGASVRVAVKSASGDWLTQKPLQTNDGAAYYGVSAGTEIKMIYSCISPDPYSVKYWKVSEFYGISPVHKNYSDSNLPTDIKSATSDIPNPVVSRVLPVGTSFGYYWLAPEFAVEIKKEAVFNYACQDRKLITIFTVKAP